MQFNKFLIEKYLAWNISDFLLKNPEKLSPEELRQTADQIQARQKAKEKLPTWFANLNLRFPPPLSIEQASSETTAHYKANLVSGNLIDFTGGMGIDTWAFAQTCQQVMYMERNAVVAETAQHNFEQLGIRNVAVHCGDSSQLIHPFTHSSTAYLDPARRADNNSKVVQLADCEPNILQLKDAIFERCDTILLKTSPLLDIKLAVSQLKNVAEVHVVAVDNEVKELLFLMKRFYTETPSIKAIELGQHKQNSFTFKYEDEAKSRVVFSSPLKFLYEPHPTLLKAGAFKMLSEQYQINKIAPNTHLYTSETRITNWFGRVFEVITVTKFDAKALQAHLENGQANISTRNFPMSVADIKKKLKISDGGKVYLFATTDAQNNRIVVVCKKIIA